MGEQIGRAPQQLDAAAFLLRLQNFGDGVEILVGFGQGFAFGGHIAVVPAIIRGAEFLDEFKGDARPLLGVAHGIAAVIPGALHGAHAKRVAAGATECVPVHHRKAQVVFHGFAGHDLAGIIVFERQGILRLGALEGDGFDLFECVAHRFISL